MAPKKERFESAAAAEAYLTKHKVKIVERVIDATKGIIGIKLWGAIDYLNKCGYVIKTA
jgi:hypothetical protein